MNDTEIQTYIYEYLLNNFEINPFTSNSFKEEINEAFEDLSDKEKIDVDSEKKKEISLICEEEYSRTTFLSHGEFGVAIFLYIFALILEYLLIIMYIIVEISHILYIISSVIFTTTIKITDDIISTLESSVW